MRLAPIGVIAVHEDRVTVDAPKYLPENLEAAFKAATCLAVQCWNASAAMLRLCIDLATKPMLPAEDIEGLNRRTRRDLEDGVGMGRTGQFVRRMHPFFGESRRRVTHERDMVSRLHRIATCRLNTGVGQQANNDDVTDAVLFQLLIEICIREPALTPVLLERKSL
jgi:hypothetical protein